MLALTLHTAYTPTQATSLHRTYVLGSEVSSCNVVSRRPSQMKANAGSWHMRGSGRQAAKKLSNAQSRVLRSFPLAAAGEPTAGWLYGVQRQLIVALPHL